MLVIHGGKPLNGTIHSGGSKNAVVALIPACILADTPSVLTNVPDIKDVDILCDMLRETGAKVDFDKPNHTLTVTPPDDSPESGYTLLDRKMGELRASYYFIGALYGKKRKAIVRAPGGCNFGARGYDYHRSGMITLGADWQEDVLTGETRSPSEFAPVRITVREKPEEGMPHPVDINLPKPSVGATINLMLAACRGFCEDKKVVIRNAAREPHVTVVADFLNAMGADISGAGTNVITVIPVPVLKGAQFEVISDQIETGTYMIAAAATKGEVWFDNVIITHMKALSQTLTQSGAVVTYDRSGVRDMLNVKMNIAPEPLEVTARYYPEFPTDLQQPMCAYLALAHGRSIVRDTLYLERTRHIPELRKLGAKIDYDNESSSMLEITINAGLKGEPRLKGTDVTAPDLRGGAALVIAALCAQGETRIHDPKGYIKRGYEDIVGKLQHLSADIEEIPDD